MSASYYFFDLDGTIIDSSSGILRSMNYALQKMGLPLFGAEDTSCFIGPPLTHVFSKHRGLSPEDTQQAISYYREFYRVEGILDCRVYRGIRELLMQLNERGTVCVLTTCKPHEYANRILAHHGLSQYFSFVSGPELDGARNEKREVIAYAMEQLQIESPASVVMIGDRDNDILGARANGIDAIGVLWGFGSREELTSAGAWKIVDTPEQIIS